MACSSYDHVKNGGGKGGVMRIEKSARVVAVLACFVAVVTLCCYGTVQAEYPDKPITLILTFAPGGLTDIMARAISIGASKYLGQPIVMEYKPGGGGAVGLGVLSTMKPDGYTLCNTQNASIVDTTLMQKVPFKPLKSFTPVVGYGVSEHSGLLVNKDAPWQTFKEFIDYARQNPGKIKYGTTGVGTGMHIAMEVLARKDDLRWVHIPYPGEGPVRTAILGNHIQAVSLGVSFPPFVQGGQLRVLATHGRTRSPLFPQVPTFHELGYDFISETTHCIIAPAGLPANVLSKLEKAFAAGMETPEFKSARENGYQSPLHATSKEYERSLQERWTKMEKLFKELKIIKEPATQPY
jgi:tripartite-type tricarboxylate transporter receptor subunit TctC